MFPAAAAASSSASAAEATLSLAPVHLLPPLVSSYLPSLPPPSVVDSGRQRGDQISLLPIKAAAPAAPGAPPTQPETVQVRKRVHVVDGVRLAARKKKRLDLAVGGGGGSFGLGVRELPDRLDLALPESGLVSQLLALESRLDATIARKHVELQHALHPTRQGAQVVRVFIWHEHTTPLTHEELINGATQHDKPECDAWILKIQGQILDANEEAPTIPQPGQNAAGRCLSNYLSAAIVQIETKPPVAAISSPNPAAVAVASTVETIEWRKHSAVALSDGFEIRRRGAGTGAEVDIQISLFLDHSPPRFRLTPALSHALGFPLTAPSPVPQHSAGMGAPGSNNQSPFPLLETQSNVLAAFWEYVKQHGLQSETDPTLIRCDQVLLGLFGVSQLPVSSVLSFLQLHLHPASGEAIVIPYQIRPVQVTPPPASMPGMAAIRSPAPSPAPVQCFDLLAYAPVQPALGDTYTSAATFSGLKSIPPPSITAACARHTDKLLDLMLDIDRCTRRREFLMAFSEAPTQVIQLLVAQHAKDALLMVGQTGVDDELERRAEYYHAEWLFDATDRMMAEEASQQTSAMQNSANMFDETPE